LNIVESTENAIWMLQKKNLYITSGPEIKLPRCQADFSPVSFGDVEDFWSFVFTPMYVFGCVPQLDERRDGVYVY